MELDKLTSYDSDFHAWTQEQADLLRRQQWVNLDLPNLIEEIEALGKQQRQELRNRLAVLIGHLLKWEYQPGKRSRSWLTTIRIQRLDIDELIEDNPSLKPYLEEAIRKAYRKSVILAATETNLAEATFPDNCPYNIQEALDEGFFPGDLESTII